jgi:type IV pilus assembly protein PilQ
MRNSVKTYLGLRFLAVVAIVCITAASAIAQDVNQPATEDANKPTIEDVNKLTAENVNKPAAEDVNKPAEEISFEQRMQKTVTITMSDADIRKVVEAVADQAGVDVVISPEVKGNVTVKLTDVPLEEALRNILAAHGFSYVATENMIRVEKGPDRTKGVEPTEPLQTKTYEIVYADVVEVVKALDKFKSKQGMATSIKGTSYIIVTDTESKIRDITAFIEKIDKMTPQILVEARIYDITSKDSFDIGTDWHVGRNTPITTVTDKDTYKKTDTTTSPTDTYERTITDTVDTIDITKTGTVTETKTTQKPATTGYGITDTKEITKDASKSWLTDATGNQMPFRKSSPFMGGGFDTEEGGTIRFGVLNDAVDIDLALSILHKQVGAKLLANPRVLVLDNETAKISIISEIPYQRLTESAMGGSIGTTEFKEVGVKLEVTPHLAARDEMIRLQLKPEFSVKTDEVKLQTTGGGLQYSQPVVDKRTADTILLIKNGQTVVLGGLRKKETTQDIRKVPLLGNLPLFGNLFRSESEDTVNSEMVVFITVWIIKEPLMSPDEQKAYHVTEFPGPKQDLTRAEKHQEQQDNESGTD